MIHFFYYTVYKSNSFIKRYVNFKLHTKLKLDYTTIVNFPFKNRISLIKIREIKN